MLEGGTCLARQGEEMGIVSVNLIFAYITGKKTPVIWTSVHLCASDSFKMLNISLSLQSGLRDVLQMVQGKVFPAHGRGLE